MERENNVIEQQLLEVCKRFQIEGEYLRYEVVEGGHINSTYKVYFIRNDALKDYIVQKLNTYVFQDPIAVMDNISSVTEYIRAKIKKTGVTAKRSVLHYAKTAAGVYYTVLPDGGFWRCCRYIDDSESYTQTANLKLIEESGKAFGKFQIYLEDYPVDGLHEVIPNFHNTVSRYEALRKAAEENQAGRLDEVRDVIEGYEELEVLATKPWRLMEQGELPLRVTHNDTKINNVMLDRATRTALCVIDLDTIMPGFSVTDFGDSIRFGANTGAEDERDLTKIDLDLSLFETYARGFLFGCGGGLSVEEIMLMPEGAKMMTLECGMRFLTDYLSGDTYFRTAYPEHNLVRSRTQMKLAQRMDEEFDAMKKIIRNILEEQK